MLNPSLPPGFLQHRAQVCHTRALGPRAGARGGSAL